MNDAGEDLLASLPQGEAFKLPPPSPQIAKLSYSHQAMVDLIVAEPWIKQKEIARRFGKTQSWISIIINSDAFQVRLAQRAAEITDPALRLTVEENFRGLMMRSLEILQEKLDKPDVSDQLALQAFALTSKAAGYGARVDVKVEGNVTHHIEEHGNRLVNLLRRTKSAVEAGEILDGEIDD